jgi:hypothetical protein
MAAFTVIDHTELSSAASSWTKSSIPSTYDHLMLKVSARTNSGYYGYVDVQLSADTTAGNYSYTRLYAYRDPPTSDRATANAYIFQTSGSSSTADTFGTATLWIPNYANTANFKQMLASSAGENASTTDSQWIVMWGAALWQSTAAVDQITLVPNADFLQYSTFTLYGITNNA